MDFVYEWVGGVVYIEWGGVGAYIFQSRMYTNSSKPTLARRERACCFFVNFSGSTVCPICLAGKAEASYCKVPAQLIRAILRSRNRPCSTVLSFSLNIQITSCTCVLGMAYLFRCPCWNPCSLDSNNSNSATPNLPKLGTAVEAS